MPTAESEGGAGAPVDVPAGATGHRGGFATTRWTVIAEAALSQSPEAGDAMEALALVYWYPLYAFLRRKGLKPEEAEDMTQEFFCRQVITRRVFRGTDPARGRFRSWLLASLQNFLHNEWDKQNAAKRGGGKPHLPLDFRAGEERYAAGLAHDLTPEKIYAKTWALTQIDNTLAELEQRYGTRGQAGLFGELKRFLPGAGEPAPYAEVAARTGKSEAAVKMAVSRLRREFGETLRAAVGRTVAGPSEVDAEVRELLAALSG